MNKGAACRIQKALLLLAIKWTAASNFQLVRVENNAQETECDVNAKLFFFD